MRSAFPAQRVVKLRYCANIALDPAGGVYFADYIFRANGLHDPDYTGTGHQPMGYDQWALFYNAYTVIGSKITARAICSSSAITVPYVFGLRTMDGSSTSYTTLEGLMENPTSSWRYMQHITNGNVPRAATATYSAKKWFNVANIKDNQDRVGGQFGGNATNFDVYFQLFAGVMDATSNLGTLYFTVQITYVVLMSDPKELVQS